MAAPSVLPGGLVEEIHSNWSLWDYIFWILAANSRFNATIVDTWFCAAILNVVTKYINVCGRFSNAPCNLVFIFWLENIGKNCVEESRDINIQYPIVRRLLTFLLGFKVLQEIGLWQQCERPLRRVLCCNCRVEKTNSLCFSSLEECFYTILIFSRFVSEFSLGLLVNFLIVIARKPKPKAKLCKSLVFSLMCLCVSFSL